MASGIPVPDGLFMCSVCFAFTPTAAAAVDDDGERWDVCRPCAEAESRTPLGRRCEAPGHRWPPQLIGGACRCGQTPGITEADVWACACRCPEPTR